MIIKITLILLVIIIFLYILNFFSEDYTDDKIGYRLGDLISGNGDTKEVLIGINKNKNSIGHKYTQKTKKSNNFKVLKDIIDSYDRENLEFVIHLRLGDVTIQHNINDLLNKYTIYKHRTGYYKNYVKPISYYKNILSKNKHLYNFTKVTVITGFHTKNDFRKDKSHQYLESFIKFLENEGFEVETRINQDPDEDFLILCKSKHLIISGGRYSDIAGKVGKLNGNKIYKNRDFNTELIIMKQNVLNYIHKLFM